MKPEEAITGISYLVAITMGWTDESVDAYVHKLTELDEPDTLALVCQRLADTWTENRRPLLAEITNLYWAEIRAREPRRRELESPHNVIDFARGAQIGRRAYEAECARQQRNADPEHFAKWAGQVDTTTGEISFPQDEGW